MANWFHVSQGDLCVRCGWSGLRFFFLSCECLISITLFLLMVPQIVLFAMMKAKKDSFPAADSDPRFLDACDVAVLL